jgi:predicted RecB family nuclease
VGVFNPHAAGQVDALFRKGNDYLVVDWKTSSGLYDSSFLQVAAYAKALSHMYERMSYSSFAYDSGININSVQACVVRLVNDYPRLPNKKKNRREPKVFSDRCEYVMVDTDMWYETFVSLVRLSHRMKEKVQKVRL